MLVYCQVMHSYPIYLIKWSRILTIFDLHLSFHLNQNNHSFLHVSSPIPISSIPHLHIIHTHGFTNFQQWFGWHFDIQKYKNKSTKKKGVWMVMRAKKRKESNNLLRIKQFITSTKTKSPPTRRKNDQTSWYFMTPLPDCPHTERWQPLHFTTPCVVNIRWFIPREHYCDDENTPRWNAAQFSLSSSHHWTMASSHQQSSPPQNTSQKLRQLFITPIIPYHINQPT